MVIGGELPVPSLIAGFLLGAGLREAYRAVRLWRRRPVPIGELGRVSGTVTVAGTAERIDDPVRAPLTGTACLGDTWCVLDVAKLGVELSGRDLFIADTDRTGALRRSVGTAVVSVVLGLAALAVLAVPLGVPF